MLKAVIYFCLFLAANSFTIDKEEEVQLEPCTSCNVTECPVVSTCVIGMVKDRCGCCDVCGLEEYQSCNLEKDITPLALGEKSGPWHGICGNGLECRVRQDIDPKFGEQSICYCKKEGIVCGSDEKTYSHCALESAIVESKGQLRMISTGPCNSAPKIIAVTEADRVDEGKKVTLSCEIQGYPMPVVTWYFSPAIKSHERIRLPGDSDEISVSLRGGPQIIHVTSHLQINEISTKHEGKYECLAENDLGVNKGNIIVTVKSNNEIDDEI